MKRMAFYFDQTKCMGCSTCAVACKDYYNVNPGAVAYRKQDIFEKVSFDDKGAGTGGFYSLSISCNHCETPACKAACGAGAITKRADGIVVIDRDKCQQLKSCITACPFAEPAIADDRQEPNRKDTWRVEIKHPMQKCNMCAGLLDKGELPVCVRACPNYALEVGDYDELMAKHDGAVQITPDKFPYAYVNNRTNTGPSFLIKPKDDVKIDKQ